VTYIVQKR